jgi:hypothetical protein
MERGGGMSLKSRIEIIVLVIVVLVLTLSCMTNTTIGEIVSTGTPRPIVPGKVVPDNTPLPTVVEPGLAYGEPCTPPCWRDMIPGQTSSQEAVQAIERLEAGGWATFIHKSTDGYIIQPLPVFEGSVFVIIEDDTVQEISGRTLFYYPVGTLVEQFGSPEGIYLKSKGGECSCEIWKPSKDPLAPGMGDTVVDLLYPQKGLAFSIVVPNSGLGCICPEMNVDGFCYYPPVTMQKMLTDNKLSHFCKSNFPDHIEDLVEWHGFGGGY